MNLEFVPIKSQKFSIGRVINLSKCDCEKCNFMNCPKNNYAVKMKRKQHKVDVFWNEWESEILKLNRPKKWQYNAHNKYNLLLTYEMLCDLFDTVSFSFPKGTYWQPTSPISYDGEIEKRVYREIALVRFSRDGKETTLGNITIQHPYIRDYNLNERQYKLAEKLRDCILWIKEKIFEHYQKQDEEWKIGWLSPTGRHYPCSNGEHGTLAYEIGSGEVSLEREGWVHIASEYEHSYFCNRRTLTAEQRNWLSLNGYMLTD